MTLSTVPFVGFRDRDQYIQRSEPIPETPHTPPAVFHISSQMAHGEPSDNRPSLSDEGPQLAPSFPEPECSCDPSTLGNHDQPPGSSSSLPYTQETPEPPLPQTLPQILPQTFHHDSHQQPEVSDGTVEDHGVNVPSTVADHVASPNTATSRGIAPSVVSVPATAVSSDTASLYTVNVTDHVRQPGRFGTGRDPYAIRELYTKPIAEESGVAEAPPEEKKSVWAKIGGLFST